MYSSEDTHRLFKIQARVDSFIYQKNKQDSTEIIDDSFNMEFNAAY